MNSIKNRIEDKTQKQHIPMAHIRKREPSSWIERSKFEIEYEKELLECRLIVLKVVRFMKENHLSQKDLAEKLDVSPQYINKFLHGQVLDMKVSTLLRYGRILGIKLIVIPTDSDQKESYQIYRNQRVDEPAHQTGQFNYGSLVGPIITLYCGGGKAFSTSLKSC